MLLTTHFMEEAERLADRVGVIVDGRLVAVDRPENIGTLADAASSIVRFRRDGTLAGRDLPPLTTGAVLRDDTEVTVQTAAPTRTLMELGAWAEAAGVPELPDLSVGRRSLEEAYLELVGSHDANVV